MCNTSWIFTESSHGKGPMDGVGAAIKNAINNVAVALESMTYVSVATKADLVFPPMEIVHVPK